MKKILFSCALLALLLNAHVAEAKKEKITSFDQFAQEYKALFGKNPNKKIWNLGHNKTACRSGSDCHTDCFNGAHCKSSCSVSGCNSGKLSHKSLPLHSKSGCFSNCDDNG